MMHQPLKNKEEYRELSQNRKKELEKRKRLIERTAPFYQSSTRVNSRSSVLEGDYKTLWGYRFVLFRDWFDFMLSFRTSIVILILIVLYTIQLLVWAAFYVAIDCEESDPPLSFQEAFAFSLETSTTVRFFWS